MERIADSRDSLLDVLLERALEGDMSAMKLCIERLCPPQKEFPLPAMTLPAIEGAEDLPKATAALLKAAVSGGVTPSALAAMSAAVKAHIEAVQTADLAERIRKLEGAQG